MLNHFKIHATNGLLHAIAQSDSKRLYRLLWRSTHTTNTGCIFCMHCFTDSLTTHANTGNNRFIEISATHLEQLLQQLIKMDVLFVSLKDIEAFATNGFPKKPWVHFSFDDGYADNYTIAYPLFKKYQTPFSVFVVSDFLDADQPLVWWYLIDSIVAREIALVFEKYKFSVTAEDYKRLGKSNCFEKIKSFLIQQIDADKAYFKKVLFSIVAQHHLPVPPMLSWHQIREMQASGLCEIGVHTQSHIRFSEVSAATQETEIGNCAKSIEQNTGIAPRYFAYPYGAAEDIGDAATAIDAVQKNGLALALTTQSGLINTQHFPKHYLPRVFLNNQSNTFSLISRISGIYQRQKLNAWDI